MMKTLKIILKIFLFLGILFLFINFIGFLYAHITPKFDIKSANSFYLYDSNENLIVQGSDEWISIDEMPNLVINATISIEDRKFFEHNGFDYLRIVKAMLENLKAGDIVQGASTITQQYARNLFLNFDQTWERKWKEMWLTFELEAHYSKDEILEGYLNTINYGHGVYGIGNASKFYFNKDIDELSLSEVSILVGIPNSPSNYSPISNYELAKERQKVVLNRMENNGFIDEKELEHAYNEDLVLYGEKEEYNLSSLMYYQDAVMEELETIDSIPKSYLETGGLKIYTALDVDAQTSLENSVKDNLVDENVQVAKVMMDPKDGEVIALIGGASYINSTYNRATSSIRQPGSTIKPFLYYRALENGFTSSSLFLSSPTTFNFDNGSVYSPKNSGNIYGNKDISMAAAMAYSDNIYAVKTHLFLGEDELVDILRDVGFTTDLAPVPSLPLGSYEVNILELAQAYAILANGGEKVNYHLINRVEDVNGNLLYQYKEKKDDHILDSSLTFIISELLTSTYDANLIDFAYPTCINMLSSITNKYAIKSGSTDTDAWVVGYNPQVVFASWAGYDDSSNISNKVVSSNKTSWINAMESYFKNNDASWYKIPDGVVGVLVNPVTGQVANNDSNHKKILYYISGTEPRNILNKEVDNSE